MSETLLSMGYKSCSDSDADVWIKREIKPNGSEYYKYMLVYVDDVLHIAHDTKEDMDKLSREYRLKEVVGPPNRYLGANIERVQLKDGRIVWSATCVDYLKVSIDNFDRMLKEDQKALKFYGDGHRPFPSSYRPEMDVTHELGE